jgi:Protein of unknown function (DUF3703)
MKHLKKKNLKDFINKELQLYKAEFEQKNYTLAFEHLERVHIVSQPFPVAHTLIHLRMLKFALIRFRPVEIFVQMLYALFSFKFSLLQIFPIGNTGGANAIKKGRMAIPVDIQRVLSE